VSDTPRTDESESESHIGISNFGHQDLYYAYKFARQLERELHAANAEIERLTNKVAQFYEGAEEAKQRIKRLEEALDCLTLVVGLTPIAGNKDALQEAVDLARAALRAKEAKP
jgi:septal ring factor EnvC (AmiA/AmiB activator)